MIFLSLFSSLIMNNNDKNHMNNKNSDRIEFIPCTQCNRKYKSEVSWIKHMKTAHNVETSKLIFPSKIKIEKGSKCKNQKEQEDYAKMVDLIKERKEMLDHQKKTLETESKTLIQEVDTLRESKKNALNYLDELKDGECTVCYSDTHRGIECDVQHFTCEVCLEHDIRLNANDRITKDGTIKCLYPECTSYLPLNKVLRFVKMDQIMKHVSNMKEKEIVSKVSENQNNSVIIQHYYDHIINKILSLSCPSCNQVYIDFTGCCALTCSRCNTKFCAWCLNSSTAPISDGATAPISDGATAPISDGATAPRISIWTVLLWTSSTQ